MSDPTVLESLSAALADAAAKVAPSVVEIASHKSLTSGFFWRDGLVVTASDALAEDGAIAIELADGARHKAQLIGRDPATDVALLRVEGVAAPTASLSGRPPRPGELTIVAAAAESAPLVAIASVAASMGPWRSMRGGRIDARIELDLRLRRRAEGGLVLDAAGEPYGMAVRGPRGRTLVIPTATIERVAPLLLEHGRVGRGFLGLSLSEVRTPEGRGLMVMSVDGDGPGARAGIVQGDVILRWDGDPVPSLHGLVCSLDHSAIGKTVTLSLRRAGAPVEVAPTIGARPHG